MFSLNQKRLMTLTTIFRSFYFQEEQKQSIISINISVHTDNHVIYVYLGIIDTKKR